MKYLLIPLIVALVACSGATPGPTAIPQPPSAQFVVEQFKAAGLSITDMKKGKRAEGTKLPNSYKDDMVFVITEVAPYGGQVFVCDMKKNCDALYAYFDALKALSGPYLYQSPAGTVVVQLNSGLKADTAAQIEKIVAGL